MFETGYLFLLLKPPMQIASSFLPEQMRRLSGLFAAQSAAKDGLKKAIYR
jgi:hypothetical protein